MSLSAAERETIIRFDDADDTATIYTCNPTWMRKLAKLACETSSVVLVKQDNYSCEYTFPKKWARVQKQRLMTEEEKQKRREIAGRLTAAREAKKTEKEEIQ